MLQFSSIAGHLQIKIAEQIGYSDQLQFVTSSKLGEDVLRLTKHKPVFDIDMIIIEDGDVIFKYVSESNFGKSKIKKNKKNSDTKKSSTIRELSQLPVLPRFKVSRVVLSIGALLQPLAELYEKAVLVSSGVILMYARYSVQQSHSVCGVTGMSAEVFLKASEMFDIKGFISYVIGLSDLFSLVEFRQIPFISIYVSDIPDELLLLLEARKIYFDDLPLDRFFTTASLFLRQWFEKKRNLEWFRCNNWNITTENIKEDILFSGVPFTFIWNSKDEVEGCQKKITLRKAISDFTFEECEEDGPLEKSVYSIDRGDKKLMIYFCSRDLIAQEYTKLDDIIEIR